ncbi:MAG: hypothetical protein GX219_05315 [Tissierellia bacterium]|nr:hypothetical protein [Tissierellia bacterium]
MKILIIILLFLTACSSENITPLNGKYSTVGDEIGPMLILEENNKFSFTYIIERSYLPNGNFEIKNGELICSDKTTGEVAVFKIISDKKLELDLDKSELIEGAKFLDKPIVDGMILEFKGEIGDKTKHVDRNVEDEAFITEIITEQDLMSLVEKMYGIITEKDPALISHTNKVAFELINGKMNYNIDENKSTWEEFLKKLTGKEVYFGGYEEMSKLGFINEKELYWEDGYIITLDVDDISQNTINFNFTIWRSGTGAYYLNDCKAILENNDKWNIKIGSEAIS